MENHDDMIFVPFLGELIGCETMSDAEAIRLANQVLSSYDIPGYAAAELERLAGMLTRHGQREAADRLESEALRLSAADLVSHDQL